jgi:uncharacterized Zn finger protein
MNEMTCKKCGAATRVTHVYIKGGSKVRRRKCAACKIVFKTIQRMSAEKRLTVRV